MKALDLFCGAGGVSVGLQSAGFKVTGVDIRPQPRYRGGAFVQADALTFPLDGYDFIWASPPCQNWSIGAARWKVAGRSYGDDLIAPARARLADSGSPYVIENVPQAPLQHPVLLCGEMFGLRVLRHRHFETNWPVFAPAHPRHRGLVRDGHYVTCAGHGGHGSGKLADWREALGIDWMTREELAQSIPPAYAEYIGRQALAVLERAA